MRCRELGIDFNLFKDNIQLQIHQSWDTHLEDSELPLFQWRSWDKMDG